MIIKVGKRIIGETDTDNRVFDKSVYKSKHLFKKFDSWGIDSDFFTDVLLPQDYTIRIFEKEDNILYKTTAEHWKKHARYFHFKQEDEDHKAQIFLSRRFFTKYNLNQ